MNGLSQLPPPPSGQKGMTLDQLGAPPAGQKGQTLQQILAQQSQPPTNQASNPVSGAGATIMGNTSPDQGAMFSTTADQATNPGTGLGIAAKTAANVVPDFVRTATGFPAAVAGQVVDVAKNTGGLFKDSAPANYLTPQANVRAKAEGMTTNQGGNQFVNTITNYLKEVPDMNTVTGTLKAVIPSAAQKLVKGDFTGAAQDIANHPFQQIAPFLMALEQGAKGYDTATGGTDATDALQGATDAVVKPVIKGAQAVTEPVVRGVSTAVKGAGNLAATLAKYGTSQSTGMSPDTISRIISNPQDFSPTEMAKYTPEGVAGEALSKINSRLTDLSETGKEYKGVRDAKTPVTIPPGTIEDVLAKHGITADAQGKLQFNKESTPTSPGDQAALQQWYSTYGADSEHTSNSFLNARKGLDNLAAFDTSKTDAANMIARDLRTTLNSTGRQQVPGLSALDTKFSSETADLKKIKTDYFSKDGTLKDNAISKIANATNKGRESVLARLEQVSPGITEKIRTLKAVQDIQAAGGQKVGAYARAAVGGVGLATGNVPAIITAILSSPQLATQILRGYGKMLGVSGDVITRVTNSYSSPDTQAFSTRTNTSTTKKTTK